jgi:VanZ family protein
MWSWRDLAGAAGRFLQPKKEVSTPLLHVNDKVQHFCAYLALSMLPVIGFRDRHKGLAAGLSMFFLGVVLELGQHFSPGRAVEFGDVLANGAGVSCGTLLGLPSARWPPSSDPRAGS